MATKQVAVKQENQVAAFGDQVPDYLKDKMNSNRGNEGVSTDDMLLPRLEIVQSQSPIKDTNEDAKEGFLFNSATGDVIGDVAYFVPIMFRKEYIVWKDKDEGGGFFGSFPTEGEAQARLREKVEGGENEEYLEIVDTPVHFGLLVSPAGEFAPQQIAISMAKSKAKVSRRFNSLVQMGGGDRFSRVYKFTTFKDKNAKNQTFYNFVVSPAGFVPENIYNEALKLYDLFKLQGVRANHDVVDEGEGGSTDRGEV